MSHIHGMRSRFMAFLGLANMLLLALFVLKLGPRLFGLGSGQIGRRLV